METIALEVSPILWTCASIQVSDLCEISWPFIKFRRQVSSSSNPLLYLSNDLVIMSLWLHDAMLNELVALP